MFKYNHIPLRPERSLTEQLRIPATTKEPVLGQTVVAYDCGRRDFWCVSACKILMTFCKGADVRARFLGAGCAEVG